MKPSKIRRIVVAVKPFGHASASALSRARLLAEQGDTEIALLGCVSNMGLSAGISAGLSTELAWSDPAMLEGLERAWTERAGAALEKLAAPLRHLGNRLTIRSLAHSPIYEGILEQVARWNADLLVVSVHEPTPLPHTRLTDTDWQLMRLCPCPLLLAKDPSLERYKAVLAAVDPLRQHGEPEELDQAILATAKGLADVFAARLCTVTAYSAAKDAADPAAQHRQALTELLADTNITPAFSTLRSGNPATVIVDLVQEQSIDLLVLGALQRSRFKALMLGSTAEEAAAGAPCDVLFVKP